MSDDDPVWFLKIIPFTLVAGKESLSKKDRANGIKSSDKTSDI